MIYCSFCGEELNPYDINTTTLCCDAPTTSIEPDFGLEFYVKSLRSHQKLRDSTLSHIRSFSADSKKRRKMYNKPVGDAAWPGKMTADTASYRALKKKRKKSPGGKVYTPSLDITSSVNEHRVSIVHPDFKVPDLVTGSSRQEARRKARSKLRGMGLSITLASDIVEEPNHTTIIYR